MAGNVETEVIDHGYDQVMEEIKKFHKSHTSVGWFGRGGDPSNDVAARMAVLELGARIRVTKKMRGYLAAVMGIHLKKTTTEITIPARGVIRYTAEKEKKNLWDVLLHEYDRVIAVKQTAKQALSRAGEWYVGRLKYNMTNGPWKPLSQVTIDRKGSSKPFIDNGQLRNAADHREQMRR